MFHQPITRQEPKWAVASLGELYAAVEARKNRLPCYAQDDATQAVWQELDAALEAIEEADIHLSNAGWAV